MIGTSFFTRGFEILDGTPYLDYFKPLNMDTLQWQSEDDIEEYPDDPSPTPDKYPLCDNKLLEVCLYQAHQHIALDFINPLFSNYRINKRRLWEGVNTGVTGWHNDLREGPNCFFLMYFSDMKTDGAVHFKNETDAWSFLPHTGLLIAVNCLSNFLHRADKPSKKRIVASFAFDLDHSSRI